MRRGAQRNLLLTQRAPRAADREEHLPYPIYNPADIFQSAERSHT